MSNIQNRAILPDEYKGKPFGMEGMSEGYDPHMLDVTQICAKSCEALTSQHIARCLKSPGIVSGSDVAELTQIYGTNIDDSALDKKVADLLSLMKQLTLDGQAELFIDPDIAIVSTNDLCVWVDIENNINVKKGMIEHAMAEEA